MKIICLHPCSSVTSVVGNIRDLLRVDQFFRLAHHWRFTLNKAVAMLAGSARS